MWLFLPWQPLESVQAHVALTHNRLAQAELLSVQSFLYLAANYLLVNTMIDMFINPSLLRWLISFPRIRIRFRELQLS